MLLPFFLLLAIPAIALAAKDSDRQQLAKLAAENNGVVKLDAKTFDLIISPQRDWSASIHFTALDKRRKCAPCREFDPSWATVAKAWSKVPAFERDSHFFATLDFDDGQTIFQRMGLQSAPVVLNYPPATGPRKSAHPDTPISHEFSHGFDAQPLAEQLSTFTPIPIPFRAPINWSKWGVGVFVALTGVLAIRFLAPVLRNRWTWATITVLTSLIMTSGYMFTRIRGMPSSGPDGWISPGFQSQYGQETTVVASLYGLLSASFLMLTLVAPLQTSPSRQRTQIYLWSGVVFILFSVLVSFFRMKNRGYPFKLLL